MLSLLLASLTVPQSGLTDMDFWVGDWIMMTRTRTSFEKAEYAEGKAENTITKIQDGKVVHENCRGENLKGESWSVFAPQKGKWQQTWVDNSGGYMLFEGGKDGSDFVLNLLNPAPDRQARMVFRDVKPDSFTWNWEQSRDKGEHWTLMIELKYKRKA
jgi:hypothetical protein